ncbi:MAG TPA: universal stress protein [Acidimicrobiales bacterium]|nr:universal stress protein [Acidimicrobiales bacterium]
MDHIVVGVDGTPTAEQAAREAAEIAKATGARLHLVTASRKSSSQVVRGGGGESWMIDDLTVASDRLKALAGTLGDGIEVTCTVLDGGAAKVVTSEAERVGADLIVVGNKRVAGVSRVLGAVALDIVRHAPCSVYIAKTT